MDLLFGNRSGLLKKRAVFLEDRPDFSLEVFEIRAPEGDKHLFHVAFLSWRWRSRYPSARKEPEGPFHYLLAAVNTMGWKIPYPLGRRIISRTNQDPAFGKEQVYDADQSCQFPVGFIAVGPDDDLIHDRPPFLGGGLSKHDTKGRPRRTEHFT